MRKRVIDFLCRNKLLNWMLPLFHYLIGHSRIVGGRSNNDIKTSNASLYRSKLWFRKGTNNILEIGENTTITNSEVVFYGSNNRVSLGKNGFFNGLKIIVEGDNCKVRIGDDGFILGATQIYVVDGSTFSMGNGCMFSDVIDIRTTDNHCILDKKTNKRINPEENVVIGNKVWVGHGVTILKGSELADGVIVGAASCITRKHTIPCSVVVGNPGREIKYDVDWKMER